MGGEYDGGRAEKGLCIMTYNLRVLGGITMEEEYRMNARIKKYFYGLENDNAGYYWVGPSYMERSIAAGLLAEICREEGV